MDGTTITQQRYLPIGQVRSDIGSISQTDFGYTGQRKLDEGMGGIMDYKARFYSPYINRFLQPDTVVPGYENPQNLNRYSYVRNNPILYLDPTGHGVDCGIGMGCVTPYTPPSTGSGGNPDRDDITEELQLPQPDELPCGGYLNCQQPLDEFLYSQLPFTSADVCASFHLDPALCDSSNWNQPYVSWPNNLDVPRSPDYITLNVAFPFPLPFLGFDAQLTHDEYDNWYVAPGGFIGLPGASVMGGWILQGEKPSEEVVEGFVTTGSFFVSGGNIVGGGVTWGHPGNYDWNDFAFELGLTSPGGDLGGTYGFLLYDNGDATPWIWQGDQ